MKTERTELARKIATECHEGQTRRDGVTPYIVHPEKVAEIVEKLGGGETEIIVAWLHDTVEDTEMTHERLMELFGPEIAEAVQALTHAEGEDYPTAVLRAKANPISRKVKMADNLANLSDSPSPKQVAKYAGSLIQLLTV
ncbi:HD domain-containing protein [Prosthecobacter sp.]|uniref:HD domain-containing protein n=1 Tax=Prosthecobacter sp. TaxID=1965333 RepID=UPI0037848ABF